MSLTISSAQTCWFSDSSVTTFPTSSKCKNFNFRRFNCPAEMLYLQKYLTNFQKLFFRWKKCKVAIGVVNFKAQTISFSNGKVTIFPTSRHCKNFNFPLYTVPAEMLYLQKYLTNFQKLFFRWKKRKVNIIIGNFKCTDIFVFQRQRYNFSNIPKI